MMIELMDTHCHIQSIAAGAGEQHTRELWQKAPNLTTDEVLRDAQLAGVNRMICVGCDLADSRLAIAIAQRHSSCYASIGIHPHEAERYVGKADLLTDFSNLATKQKVVAIGECGLDYYYEHSTKASQWELLRFQIELALKHSLAVIFHVREAFDDFWPIFDGYPGIRGVLHSFTDSVMNLDKALQRGLYIGVNGIATFSKQAGQMAIYRAIPLENLLIETDAPYLTPVPYRGTINQPKNARVVAEFMAASSDHSFEALSAVTTNNAQSLFGINTL